ncbi:MAG: TrkA family potassium uptake protein [Actinomycetales bacterium]|nr:TrkA family potassium uptake protein [Actinomycetales bacterium]
MRVVIVGAGQVGRAIAGDLLASGHEVALLDRDPAAVKPDRLTSAAFLVGDACEIDTLERADLPTADVVVAATGDDKVNLVVALLAKTEYGVPRVVARVNHPKNEWMFDESWGVDVAVSTPRMLTALVEEAVSVGDLVRLMTFRHGGADLVELTLPTDCDVVGRRVDQVAWPADTALVAILRDGRVLTPSGDHALEAGDELIFVATPEQEAALAHCLGGRLAAMSEPPETAAGR